MIDLKRIAAAATIAGAVGLTGLGIGTGVANAAPQIPWQQDGHGHGHWHGDDWGGDDGGDGNWGPGPGWGWGGVPGPYGCISGPVGFGFAVGCI